MIHINFTCDGCHSVAVGAGFDAATETFGDLLAHMVGLGWNIADPVPSHGARTLCPACAPAAQIDAPAAGFAF